MAVTLKDVARLAGSSVSAVSSVLNRGGGKSTRVGAETRERILNAAAQLGYSPNAIAKSLATGRTGVVGITLPYDSTFLTPDPWGAAVVNGIVSELVKQGYNLLLYLAAGGHFETEVALAKDGPRAAEGIPQYDPSQLVDSRVDGLIVILSPKNDQILAACKRVGRPLVSILRNTDDPSELTVNANDYEGARLATQHLIDLGHRRIGHIYGWSAVPTTEPRVHGYRDALLDSGIEPEECLIVQGDFNREQGRMAMERILELGNDRPTGMFCCNDICAHGAIDAIRAAGLRVPEDISVVGYDNSEYATLVDPLLTTIDTAASQMGSRAVKLLIAAIEGRQVVERQPVLSVSLVVRASTAPVGARATASRASHEG